LLGNSFSRRANRASHRSARGASEDPNDAAHHQCKSGPDERFATPLFDADRSVSILDDENPRKERNAAFLMEFLESVQPLSAASSVSKTAL
jgi:hypothetical protein